MKKGIILLSLCSFVCANQLALLAGTLRTFQQHACDGSTLSLACPINTTIDIAFARYGRPRTTHGASGGGVGVSVEGMERDPCPPLPTALGREREVKNVCEYPEEVNYNTIQLVVSRCQHKQQCAIDVAPSTFSTSDPCPDTRKYIEVAFKCRPKTFINKEVCQGGELVVSCGMDARLAIYSVLFGRSREGSFICPQPEGVPEEECQASYANEIVMRQCHGKRECNLEASPRVFGNPCSPRSNVYMKAVYTCVPKKILKQSQEEEEGTGRQEEMQGVGAGRQPEEGGEGGGGYEEGSLRSPAAPPPPEPSPSTPHHHNQYHQTPTTSFYNPTVTTWLSDRKSDEREKDKGGGLDWGREGIGGGGGGGGGSQLPPHPPGPPSPPLQPELINCTVTVLAGVHGREIGFLTEWMRAVAFVKGNFEKFLLYLLLGLCAGLVLFLVVVVGQLLWERRRAKRAAKTLHDPLTSVFAADIDDIDADLDLDGTGGSISGGLGVVGGMGGGGSLPRSPSPHNPQQQVVRYNAYSTYGGRTRAMEDTDGNPRSLTRTNNNQLFYS